MAAALVIGVVPDTDCSLCHEAFKEPKIMPCGHVVCRPCLLSWLQAQPQPVCPICRRAVLETGGERESQGTKEGRPGSLEEEVGALPTDLALAELMEARALLDKDHICCVCEDVAATALCLHCRDMLCAACRKAHEKMTTTKHHTVQDLSSLTPDALAASRPSPCSSHPGEACRLFCPAHGLSVCVLCVAARHKSCTDLKDLEVITEEARVTLADMAASLSASEHTLRDAILQLDHHVQTTAEQVQAALDCIQETCDNLESGVKNCRGRMTELVHEAGSDIQKRTQAAIAILQGRKAVVTSHTAVVTRAEGSKSHVTVSEMSAVMGTRLQQLDCGVTLPASDAPTTMTFSIDEGVISTVEKALAELGQINLVPAHHLIGALGDGEKANGNRDNECNSNCHVGDKSTPQGSLANVKVHPTSDGTQATVPPRTRETELVTACLGGSLAVVKSLVDKGQASLECCMDMTVGGQHYKGMTPLLAASQTGNVEIVKWLVSQGASVKSQHVVAACIGGHVEIVRHLLEKGADVNSTNTQKKTLLIIASREGHVDIVTALLTRGASVNTTDNDGWTALMRACLEGHVDIVTALLTRGARVNTTDNDGWTALMLACQEGHVDIVTALLTRGASVNTTDNDGYTALMHACQEGHVDIVTALLTRGASVNTTDNDGYTALMSACQEGHVDIVTALLTRGASVNTTDNDGWTALMRACQEGHVDIVTALLTRGASVNTTDNDGYTALMHACQEGHVDIVTALLTRGASVNTTDNDGYTALMSACQEGHVDIVTALLTRGASVNTTDNDGWTALMLACQEGHVDIVTALLAHEADVNIAVPSEDDTLGGRTALHENAINGNVPILELLLSHGATFSRDCDGDTPLLLAAIELHDDYVDRCLRVPDLSRSDKADALEVLGAVHWAEEEDDDECPEQWQRAMEERHRAGSPAVCKKTATKVAVLGLATEVQTPGELDKLRQSADRLALGTQAVLVAERVLGKAHRTTEFIIRDYALLYADNDRYDRALTLLLYSLENMSAVNPFKGYSMLCHAQVVDIQVRGQSSASPNLHFCDGLTFLRRTVSALTRAGAAPSGSQDGFPTERQHLLRIVLHAVCLLQRTLNQASPAERRDYLQAVKELVGRTFRGEGGDTLLHMACDADTEVFHERMDVFKGCPFPSPEVVQALLEAGCDRSTRNTAGLTALQVAGDHDLIVGLLSLSIH